MIALQSPDDLLDLLVFSLDAQQYALPAASVVEIVRAVTITPLPGSLRVVEGIINLRGSWVPVLDLRARFGLPARPVAPGDLLIIANSRSHVVAVRSDGAVAVRRLDAQVFPIARDALSTSRLVAGLATIPDGTVVIHDLAAFLSEAESAELELMLANVATRAVA